MTKKAQSARPFVSWVLAILLLLIGVGALISGPMLFLSPSGKLMQMSTKILQGTPFNNYLAPGIILFLFVGVFPVLVGYGLLRLPGWSWAETINPCKRYHWSWTASWAAGSIMLIWITVETLLLGYISFLQPLIAVWGIIIIMLAAFPSIRGYYRVKRVP